MGSKQTKIDRKQYNDKTHEKRKKKKKKQKTSSSSQLQRKQSINNWISWAWQFMNKRRSAVS